jgi:Heterogeneous nuclear ribonucleoprotein Q acidic domain
MQAVDQFAKSNLDHVRNRTGFFMSIIRRVREEASGHFRGAGGDRYARGGDRYGGYGGGYAAPGGGYAAPGGYAGYGAPPAYGGYGGARDMRAAGAGERYGERHGDRGYDRSGRYDRSRY